MQVNKINSQSIKGINLARFMQSSVHKTKKYKYMKDSCSKFGEILGQSTAKLVSITEGADIKQFNFLKTMVNKFNKQKYHNIMDDSEYVLKIYSIVEKPNLAHINIVSHSNDSFEFLEKIFLFARDEKSLEFVQNMQHDILRDAKNPSKIIADLLASKNKDKFVNKPERYASYLKLHANDEKVVSNLDSLIDSGKYSRFHSDAQLAIKNLMKKQNIGIAMSGKSLDLVHMYTKDRANFLTKIVMNFMHSKKSPKEETKAAVVHMYGTLDSANAKLRSSVIEMFKNTPVKDKAAELIDMQTLFNKIDNDAEAKKFVQKTVDSDLRLASIAELNEILENTPLKKANIFFKNAKRIIEKSTGDERKNALVVELENPFFESKQPKVKNARMIHMFEKRNEDDGFFNRAYKIIENKINRYRYSRSVA